MKSNGHNIIIRIIRFIKGYDKVTNKGNIREVYFGLRIRFLGLLSLVMILIIAILTSIVYHNQNTLIKQENYV